MRKRIRTSGNGKNLLILLHSIPIISNKYKKTSLRPGISYHCDHSSISLHSIPLLCSMALLGLGVGLVNPSMHGGMGGSNGTAYAAPIVDDINEHSSISFSLTSSNGTEIGNDSTISTEATPGLVNYITTNIKLTTTLIDRFYVGVQSTSSNSNLIGTNNKATIAPVETVDGNGISPSSFKDNTWGYALSDNTSISNSELVYLPLPSYSTNTPVQYTSTNNLANGDYNLKLVFAAKINASQPADHYTTNAIISVAADAKEIGFLNASGKYITTMQEMTPTICSGAPEGYTTQLKDSRDNKYYWVSKLADGNCWMTQNLDFDIPAQLNTDGITSDVPTANFTTDTIKVNAPSDWPANNDNPNYNGYYNPGDYVYNGPSDPAHGQGTTCSANNSNADALALCTQFSKSSIGNTNAQVLGDTNRHYHVGNYYSFSAATAKSGDDITSGSALQSICPKGWSLPTGSNNGQFAELLTKYGVNNSLTNGSYAIYKEPLYFVYGGGLRSSALSYAGSHGYYWSSTVNSGTDVFRLTFGSNVYPADSGSRYYGFPVRCVAR